MTINDALTLHHAGRLAEAEAAYRQIQAADLGLVPYTEPDQISSGILPIMLACGRPVLATKFECAKSVSSAVGGVFLAEINNPDSLFARLSEITAQPGRLRPMMQSCYAQTRQWLWKHSAAKYGETFSSALEG